VKLSDLEPELFKLAENNQDLSERVATLADAQGVYFLCPKCFAENGGAVGTHAVRVLFRGRNVPDDAWPLPGRWDVSGTGIDDLTLTPSIHLTGAGCGWHGFITNGLVT